MIGMVCSAWCHESDRANEVARALDHERRASVILAACDLICEGEIYETSRRDITCVSGDANAGTIFTRKNVLSSKRSSAGRSPSSGPENLERVSWCDGRSSGRGARSEDDRTALPAGPGPCAGTGTTPSTSRSSTAEGVRWFH